jgi:hypothetical protein
MANRAAKKVPGRNTMVMMGMIFIEVLSFFAERAIAMLDAAS